VGGGKGIRSNKIWPTWKIGPRIRLCLNIRSRILVFTYPSYYCIVVVQPIYDMIKYLGRVFTRFVIVIARVLESINHEPFEMDNSRQSQVVYLYRKRDRSDKKKIDSRVTLAPSWCDHNCNLRAIWYCAACFHITAVITSRRQKFGYRKYYYCFLLLLLYNDLVCVEYMPYVPM